MKKCYSKIFLVPLLSGLWGLFLLGGFSVNGKTSVYSGINVKWMNTGKTIITIVNPGSSMQVAEDSDYIPPVIKGTEEIAISCSSDTSPDSVEIPTVTDNIDPNPQLSYEDSISYSSYCAANYDIIRVWTASDASGNQSVFRQIIQVSDTTPPVLDCPNDTTVTTPDDIPDADLSLLSATDNCSPDSVLIFELIDENYTGLETAAGFCPSSVTRTYAVTDDCGNTTTCEQTITVDSTQNCSTCTTDAAFQLIDLSGNPDSAVTITVTRSGQCCGITDPNVKCATFNIRLDENAAGIQILVDGTSPAGQEWTQDCQTLQVNNGIVCLDPGSFHQFTFCKSGSGGGQLQNTFTFRSIPALLVEDTEARVNCTEEIVIGGEHGTLTWTDLSSDDGRYESYIQRSSNDSVFYFTPDENSPSVLNYQFCGSVPDNYCEGAEGTCSTIEIRIRQEIRITLAGQTEFCENTPDTLKAIVSPDANYTIQWYNESGVLQATGESFSPSSSGNYYVTVTDSESQLECSEQSLDFSVTIYPDSFELGADTTICAGNNSYTVTLPEGSSYFWSPTTGVTALSNYEFQVSPDSTTTYAVTSLNPEACLYTDTFTVNVINCIGICPTDTVCPSVDVTINTINDFINAGGSLNFPCEVDSTSTTAIQLIETDTITTGCPLEIHKTYQLTDNCGNLSTCTFIIVQNDTISPELTCPADQIYQACSTADLDSLTDLPYASSDQIISDSLLTIAGGIASDDCGISEISYFDQISDTTNYPLEVIRTFTITDLCQNQTQCSQYITLEDTIAPDFTVSSNVYECVRGLWNMLIQPSDSTLGTRDEYFIFLPGDNLLDLDSSLFIENCTENCPLEIEWRVDFADGTGLPSTDTTEFETGQPSLYNSSILFPGDGTTFLPVVHQISYRLTDCHNNSSVIKKTSLQINPRPQIVKQ